MTIRVNPMTKKRLENLRMPSMNKAVEFLLDYYDSRYDEEFLNRIDRKFESTIFNLLDDIKLIVKEALEEYKNEL